MGRNAGTQFFWTHAHNGTSNNIEFQCQQHAMFEQKQHSGLGAASSVLKTHIEVNHGCVEQ